MALDWTLRRTSPAEMVGLVNLDRDQIWMFKRQEFAELAMQETDRNWHFGFYVEPEYFPTRTNSHEREFESFRIERRMAELFGLPLLNSS